MTESDNLLTHFIVLQYSKKIKSVHRKNLFHYIVFIPIVLAIDSCFIHLLIPFLSCYDSLNEKSDEWKIQILNVFLCLVSMMVLFEWL